MYSLHRPRNTRYGVSASFAESTEEFFRCHCPCCFGNPHLDRLPPPKWSANTDLRGRLYFLASLLQCWHRVPPTFAIETLEAGGVGKTVESLRQSQDWRQSAPNLLSPIEARDGDKNTARLQI